MTTILRKTLISRFAAELERAAHEATDLEVIDLGDESFVTVAADALIELSILSARRGRQIALKDDDVAAINACASSMRTTLAAHCDAAIASALAREVTS